MNVAELAEQIATSHDLDKKQARSLVEGVFKAVVEAAQHGDEVSIPGFGKFKVASREARQGRNPATGETIQIAASKKLNFTPAKQVKDAMNPPPAAPAAKAAPAKAAPKSRAKK
ncbi:MAG: HU family DNA-binding protein [Pseudomonadota bacterium]|nr:HU family DNA-binding protein [Pseudomonadota bacterium]